MPRAAAALVLLLTLGACRRAAPPGDTPSDGTPPEGAPTATADTLGVTGFTLASEGAARVATLADGTRLVLLRDGQTPPPGAGGTVVRVPARRIVALSTTHVGFLDALGATQNLAAVAGAPWIASADVQAALAAGRIVDVGTPDGGVNAEAVAAVWPDLVLVSAGDEAVAQRLSVLGVPVVALAEHREPSPVARAAWLRLVGALVGREAAADTAVAGIAGRYAALRTAAQATSNRPTVLLGAPFRGVWHVPGGGTFPARLVADAGGAYLWAGDTVRTARPMSLEVVLERARHADAWLDPAGWHRLADGLADEPRMRLFDAFRERHVWAPDAQLSPGGGYAIHESGVAAPDVVLADLVCILHPELRPGCTTVYYRRLD